MSEPSAPPSSAPRVGPQRGAEPHGAETATPARAAGESGLKSGARAAGVEDALIRSARFRAEREASWRRLEELLDKLNRKGPLGLTPEELMETPQLYRAALSALSVSRSFVFDKRLTDYLEALCARAHLLIYAPREGFFAMTARIFAREIPRAVRRFSLHLLLASLTLLLGALLGRMLVIDQPDIYFSIVGEEMASGRSPEASTESMRDSIDGHDAETDQMLFFAQFLINNNVLVSLLAFGLGVALGVPTLLLLFYNGVAIGAMVGAFALHGLEAEFLAWLTVHGTTELLAIAVAGAGGLAIANAMMFPPPQMSRLAGAAVVGRRAGLLAVAAIMMLFVAGLLEAFVRDSVTEAADRVAIGVFFGAVWLAYFALGGRGRQEETS